MDVNVSFVIPKSFIKTINKDKIKYVDHVNAISSYVNLVADFCENILKILNNYIENKNIIKLKYNSDMIEACVQDFDNIILFLNEAIASLNDINMPLSFKYRSVVKIYIFELKNNVKIVSKMKDVFYNINLNIKHILDEFKEKSAKIEFKEIDDNSIVYDWNVVSSNIDLTINHTEKEYGVSNGSVVSFENSEIEFLDTFDVTNK